MNLSKIKLKKELQEYACNFKKAIEAETGLKIEDILTRFQVLNYSYVEVAEHVGCSPDVIYKICKRLDIKLASKRNNSRPEIVDTEVKQHIDYLSKKWVNGTW